MGGEDGLANCAVKVDRKIHGQPRAGRGLHRLIFQMLSSQLMVPGEGDREQLVQGYPLSPGVFSDLIFA